MKCFRAIALLIVLGLVGCSMPGFVNTSSGDNSSSDRALSAGAGSLAVIPAMGWSSWSSIRSSPTEAKLKAQADQMAIKLKSHGYQYINLDDFYYKDPNTTVDQYGRWVVDDSIFPSGFKALADYIHGKGLKFGVYVTPGIPSGAVKANSPIQGTPYHAKDIADTSKFEKNYNNHYNKGTAMYYIDFSKPGSQEFINSWANLFASYGADYVKLDGVGSFDKPDVEAWSKALAQTGRPMWLALSNNLSIADATEWRTYANSWRTQGDIESYNSTLTDWSHVSARFNSASNWAKYAGPGGWLDLDSLDVADGAHDGLTNDEKQTYVSLWAMAASEFIVGSDLTNTDSYGLSLLTNDAIIAVDQSGSAGTPLQAGAAQQVWRKSMKDGSLAVGLFNTASTTATVTVNFSDLGFSGSATVKNLWTGSTSTASGSYSATLATHASQMLNIKPANSVSFNGTYRIINKKSGLALTVPGSSTAQNVQLQQIPYAATSNQKWTISQNSDGTFKIVNLNSGLAAVVQGASTVNGAAVIQYAFGGSNTNDEWQFYDVGGGYYRIANQNSSLAMVVLNASTASGANIIQYTYNATGNDAWQIVSP